MAFALIGLAFLWEVNNESTVMARMPSLPTHSDRFTGAGLQFLPRYQGAEGS